jgi:hypothetical protein
MEEQTYEEHDVADPQAKAAKSARAIARYEAPPSDVAPWQPSALALLSDEEFELRIALAVKERERIAKIQRAVMKDGVDYGVIPGTDKPTLYKPGAEILNRLAGLAPEFEVTREVGDGITSPSIRYQIKCRLVSRDGMVIASGDGSCNSWERKYRYRRAERLCPSCSRNTIFRSKHKEEWFCWVKKGGCGDTFAVDHPEIIGQSDTMENPDPHDLDNTMLKIGTKRAMLAATLIGHAGSGIFTQDLEPDEEEEGGPPPKARNGGGKRSEPATDEKIGPGQKTLAQARAKKRAAELGLADDGYATLLKEVLDGGNVRSLDDVAVSALPDLLAAIDQYEMPG